MLEMYTVLSLFKMTNNPFLINQLLTLENDGQAKPVTDVLIFILLSISK